MNRYLRWTFLVAQFVVAGGLIRALDAWLVHLVERWQFTALAATQLAVAFAHAFLERHGTFQLGRRPMPYWNRRCIQRTCTDRQRQSRGMV
jgi:hypothetical protein